jgi:integrase
MPKPPKFAFTQTPKGWRVRVPKSLSDTGKDQARFFPSRRKAEDFAKSLREQYRSHGEGTSVLPPRVADDAFRAWMMLEPHGVSLTEAARAMVTKLDAVARSVKIEVALQAWEDNCEARKLRAETVASYKATAKKLLTAFTGRILAEIPGAEVGPAIKGKSYELHRRNASAFWRWSAKPPRRWCDAAEFAEVEALRVKNENDIGVLTPEQAETLLRTAEKYFPEAVPIYALGLFGGPRKRETMRLEEDDVSSEGVEIGKAVAKKNRRRHIPMNDTLKAWLEAYPFVPCPNWVEKDKIVRRLAGWDVKPHKVMFRTAVMIEAGITPKNLPPAEFGPWPRNAIRHTHASAEVANGATMEDLLFRFGHSGSVEILRSHYVGRYTKKQAIALLSLGPRGSVVPLLKSA